MLRSAMNATDTLITEACQRELAAGVLQQAAQDLRRFHGATTTIERELYFDAFGWLMSEDCSGPFSFLNVCQLLNLSPEDVRQELVGDLSLGTFGKWARRCGRAARRVKLHLGQRFTAEHNVSAAEPVSLVDTVH